jgi:hypothetical protein
MGNLDPQHYDRLALLRLITDSDVEELGKLSETDYQRFDQASGQIQSFRHWERTIDYARENYAEWEAFFSGLQDDPAVFDLPAERLHELFFQANRRLLNFLSAARTFLDYTETRLKRQYGDTSSEAQQFLRAASSAYDSTFAYRFLYRLRNYAQHCGLPIGEIDHTGTKKMSSGEVVQVIRIFFDIDHLLTYTGWSTVADELKQLQPKLQLGPQPGEFMERLNELHDTAVVAQSGHLMQASTEIMQVLQPGFSIAGTATVVGQILPGSSLAKEFRYELPPYDTLRELGLIP